MRAQTSTPALPFHTDAVEQWLFVGLHIPHRVSAHRACHYLSNLLAVSLTAIHLGALVAGGYVHFGLADLIVPFASQCKPGAVAQGVIAI